MTDKPTDGNPSNQKGPKEQPLRFFTIRRESSVQQRDHYGPREQWREFERFAKNWPGGPHVISEALSATVIESATKPSRPMWEAAVRKAIGLYNEDKVDALLFPRVDRETRNIFSSIPVLNMAFEAGMPVYFAQERLQLDPKDPDSRARYEEEAKEAAAYVRRMQKLTKPARIARGRDDQKNPLGRNCFGFDNVGGYRVLNPAQAEALRGAAEVLLRVGKPQAAADYVNELGFQTQAGKKFTGTTFSQKRGLFRNPAMIGLTTVCWREETVIVRHEPILDQATWDALQIMLDSRRLRTPRGEVPYWISGICVCGCGRRFGPSKSSRGHRYYRCVNNCGERWYRKELLEWEVFNSFMGYLRNRLSREKMSRLAAETAEKLGNDLGVVEQDLDKNLKAWGVLLRKDLADYPDILIAEERRRLKAARDSLLASKVRIEGDLSALPALDPATIEAAIEEISKPFETVAAGWTNAEKWEQYIQSRDMEPKAEDRALKFFGALHDLPKGVSDTQGKVLRETLLRLNCKVIIKNHQIKVIGQMPVDVSANKSSRRNA